jgi:FixJ family two-component response regulator
MTEKAVVYLLDDEPSMLRALSRLLRMHDFTVRVFESVAEFFEFQRDGAPACLVLDIAMPDLDGLEVQKRLAETHDTIPIIFLTGRGDIPISVRAMKAGAEDFLTKPVDGEELVRAVNSALDSARAKRAAEEEVAELRKRLDQLTPRQREVFEYVIAGKMNKNIAAELGTGEQNVKIHRRRVMRKMGVKSLAELVRSAERLGIEPAI